MSEALERLFLEECGKDLARFLQRLTLAGLRLVEDGNRQGGQASCSDDKTTDTILRHYLPFITQKKPHDGTKPHGATNTTDGLEN